MKDFNQFYCRTLLYSGAFSLFIILLIFLPGKLNARSFSEEKKEGVTGILPGEEIFDPLMADPRWPHSSASLQIFQDEARLRNVGSANLGASFALLGCEHWGGKWQIGLQAGVFSIFDLDAPSDDLVNSDFRVGLPLSVRYGFFSAQAKIYHQSSHLGDEFLLRNHPERLDLTYDGIDLLLSLDLGQVIRIYGGGGKLIRSNPDLEKYSVHGGLELVSPGPLFASAYPVAALDVQSFEETEWNENYSAQAGFEIRSSRFANRRLLVLFEYYKGNSPNGQFYELNIKSYGYGIHFFF